MPEEVADDLQRDATLQQVPALGVATHLLEQKVDIRIIQALLGYKKLDTTVIYTQVATDLLHEVVSPLETLQPV